MDKSRWPNTQSLLDGWRERDIRSRNIIIAICGFGIGGLYAAWSEHNHSTSHPAAVYAEQLTQDPEVREYLELRNLHTSGFIRNDEAFETLERLRGDIEVNGYLNAQRQVSDARNDGLPLGIAYGPGLFLAFLSLVQLGVRGTQDLYGQAKQTLSGSEQLQGQ